MEGVALNQGLVPVPVAEEHGGAEFVLGQAELPPSPADARCLCCHETWVLGSARMTAMGWVTSAAALCTGMVFLTVYEANIFVLLAAYGINVPVFWRLWWRKHRSSADLDMIVKVFGFTFFCGVLLAMAVESLLLVLGALLLIPDSLALDNSNSQQNLTNEWYLENTQYDPATCQPPDCILPKLPCDALRNITSHSSDMTSVPSQLPKTVGLFLYLLFVGYIDAAMVEESVKLLAARGKACCFWKLCRCHRCHPCCYPGWRNGGRLRDPYAYIIYMVGAAAGFSTAENLEYLFLTDSAHQNHISRPDCFPVRDQRSVWPRLTKRLPYLDACVYSTRLCTLSDWWLVISSCCCDALQAESAGELVLNMSGRLLLAYPLHLVCGALTAVQLIRRNLLPLEEHSTDATGEQEVQIQVIAGATSTASGGTAAASPTQLHWGWVLVPAIITHGTYDSVLFVLAALTPGAPGTSEEEVPVSEMDFSQILAELVLLPVGWIYLAIPLFWLRRKLVKADLPALHAAAVEGDEQAQGQNLTVFESRLDDESGVGEPQMDSGMI